MWGERRGGERCHAGWWCFVLDVYRAMHDGACAVSGHNKQQWWFAHVPGNWPKSTPLHPRRLCPSPSQLMALCLPSFLMENSNGAIRHLSQYRAKNHRLSVDISAAVLRWWLFTDLCGLWSITAGPNEHKLSYSPSFQSSPVLHCALFQVFGVLCPQPVILNDLIHSLLVAFSGGCSRATAPRLIFDARVPIFKMFHPSSNTARTHAHTSISTLKSGEFLQQGFPL